VKRMLLLLVVSALVVAMMAVGAGPASAQGPPADTGHPFCGSGAQFADEHITFEAERHNLGPGQDGHTPGFHQGFATCDPAGVFEPPA
jgi:Spy/CpxP family protein refolding chaperone